MYCNALHSCGAPDSPLHGDLTSLGLFFCTLSFLQRPQDYATSFSPRLPWGRGHVLFIGGSQELPIPHSLSDCPTLTTEFPSFMSLPCSKPAETERSGCKSLVSVWPSAADPGLGPGAQVSPHWTTLLHLDSAGSSAPVQPCPCTGR